MVIRKKLLPSKNKTKRRGYIVYYVYSKTMLLFCNLDLFIKVTGELICMLLPTYLQYHSLYSCIIFTYFLFSFLLQQGESTVLDDEERSLLRIFCYHGYLHGAPLDTHCQCYHNSYKLYGNDMKTSCDDLN